ncbi:isopentenyl transferase family protein [Actinacidiphila glaucinigra]|uniref:isopentenyl transferase family protein n=1 Tax=Actinacidiphila glaucinigra TaxID=235986 RepID=UPI003694EA36
MLIHLILGPTGVGKSARSIALARRHDSPVVVLDRVQCHPQLAVGSGRLTYDELQDTIRYYLTERPVHHGTISAAEGVDRLVHHRKMLADAGVDRVVLEGGSISILDELLTREDWCQDATVQVECWLESGVRAYTTRVTERVEQMLGYGHQPGRTLIDEIADLWLHPEVRPHLRQVVGYREVISLCAAERLDPRHLRGLPARLRRATFTAAVTASHLTYAHQQRQALAAALPALADRGFEVTLCET